jgi:hypothetical protein
MTGSNSFSMNVILDYDSGFFLCPKHKEIPLEGSCTDGNITLKTDIAKLEGTVNDAGTSADLHGTVTIGTTTASVNNLHLDKR